jgi:A/G-specific adenine glycosylase
VFEQILAEVFLQRTQAENVSRFFRSFVAKYPSWLAIAQARRSSLEKELRPLGLWRRRASSLSLLARELSRRGGVLPESYDEAVQLPGVGQYIGNAITLFQGDAHAPLLDTNMARLLERFFRPRKLADIRYDPFLQRLAHEVVRSRKSKEINWAILDFASLVCSIKPKCPSCPLRAECNYFRKAQSSLALGRKRPD